MSDFKQDQLQSLASRGSGNGYLISQQFKASNSTSKDSRVAGSKDNIFSKTNDILSDNKSNTAAISRSLGINNSRESLLSVNKDMSQNIVRGHQAIVSELMHNTDSAANTVKAVESMSDNLGKAWSQYEHRDREAAKAEVSAMAEGMFDITDKVFDKESLKMKLWDQSILGKTQRAIGETMADYNFISSILGGQTSHEMKAMEGEGELFEKVADEAKAHHTTFTKMKALVDSHTRYIRMNPKDPQAQMIGIQGAILTVLQLNTEWAIAHAKQMGVKKGVVGKMAELDRNKTMFGQMKEMANALPGVGQLYNLTEAIVTGKILWGPAKALIGITDMVLKNAKWLNPVTYLKEVGGFGKGLYNDLKKAIGVKTGDSAKEMREHTAKILEAAGLTGPTQQEEALSATIQSVSVLDSIRVNTQQISDMMFVATDSQKVRDAKSIAEGTQWDKLTGQLVSMQEANALETERYQLTLDAEMKDRFGGGIIGSLTKKAANFIGGGEDEVDQDIANNVKMAIAQTSAVTAASKYNETIIGIAEEQEAAEQKSREEWQDRIGGVVTLGTIALSGGFSPLFSLADNIGDGIVGISSAFENIGETVSNIFTETPVDTTAQQFTEIATEHTTLMQDVSNAIDGITTQTSELNTSIQESTLNSLNSINNSIIEGLESFDASGGFTSLQDNITDFFNSIFSSSPEVISEAVSSNVDVVTETATDAIVAGTESAVDSGNSMLDTIIPDTQDAISSLASNMSLYIGDTITSIKDAILPSKEFLQQWALVGVGSSTISALLNDVMFNDSKGPWGKIVTGISDQVKKAGIDGAVKTITTGIITGISRDWEQTKQRQITFWTNDWKQTAEDFQKIKEKFTDLTNPPELTKISNLDLRSSVIPREEGGSIFTHGKNILSNAATSLVNASESTINKLKKTKEYGYAPADAKSTLDMVKDILAGEGGSLIKSIQPYIKQTLSFLSTAATEGLKDLPSTIKNLGVDLSSSFSALSPIFNQAAQWGPLVAMPANMALTAYDAVTGWFKAPEWFDKVVPEMNESISSSIANVLGSKVPFFDKIAPKMGLPEGFKSLASWLYSYVDKLDILPRERGGRVQPYLVGEKGQENVLFEDGTGTTVGRFGPEIVTFAKNGHVFTADETKDMGAFAREKGGPVKGSLSDRIKGDSTKDAVKQQQTLEMVKHTEIMEVLESINTSINKDPKDPKKKGILGGLLGLFGSKFAEMGLVGSLGYFFKTLLTGAAGWIGKGIGSIFGKIKDILPTKKVMGMIAKLPLKMIGLTIGWFTEIIPDMVDGWETDGIVGAIKGIFTVGDGGFMGVFKGMGKYAVMGATIGSAIPVPVVGTLVGGLVGAALGGILGFFGDAEIAEGFKPIGDWFSNKWADVLASIKDKISGFFNIFGIGDDDTSKSNPADAKELKKLKLEIEKERIYIGMGRGKGNLEELQEKYDKLLESAIPRMVGGPVHASGSVTPDSIKQSLRKPEVQQPTPPAPIPQPRAVQPIVIPPTTSQPMPTQEAATEEDYKLDIVADKIVTQLFAATVPEFMRRTEEFAVGQRIFAL
jgi:hypothetical protein